jgi:hypothetical protein
MLQFKTQGTAYERGRQQGEACADLAWAWMERALINLARERSLASIAEAVECLEPEVSQLRRQAERVAPETLAECAGIARGMGMDEPTYFTAIFGWQLGGAGTACSVLGWRDPDGRPMLAKTDDIYLEELGSNVLQFACPAGGLSHAVFHFAGTPWAVAGMNEAGLAMGMTGIPGPSLCTDGCSYLIALHSILPHCTTVPEALDAIAAQRLNHRGYSLTLASAGGDLAQVERNGAGMVVLPGRSEGFWAHTNHILDRPLAAASPQQVEPILTNSHRRLARITEWAPELPRNEAGLEAFLTDRGSKDAIWQTGSGGLYTDFGVLFVPAVRRMRVWTGQPKPIEQRTAGLEGLSDA